MEEQQTGAPPAPVSPPCAPSGLELRLREAPVGPVLNLAYLEGGLPEDFVPAVLSWNPGVQELDLSSNHLADLPASLAGLQQLRVLRLKYNGLQALPLVLASLPRLAVLELSGNQIAEMDGTVLAQLSALRDLDLSGCGLKALPEQTAELGALETLRLGNNALEALPPQLGACPALVRLDVSSNRLLALPPTLAQLPRIQRIDCKNNFLTRVPPCLGRMALKEFDLRYNKLNKSYTQAAEKGLARFLSFLRDEEEIERLQEIERNKPVGQQVGACTVYKCRTVTADAVEELAAGAEGAGAELCWVRSGFALCSDGDKMLYMFGGSVLKDGGRKSGELFWMTTDRMDWRLQPTHGDRPCQRDGHSMVFDPVRRRLVVFGGRKQNKRRLNDVYFLDLTNWTWYQPRTEGVVPSPRNDCSALYHDSRMIIFGGRSSSTRLNELHALDLDHWCWLVPEASGSAPSPRQGAALTMHEGKLWVHGGRSNFVLDDCFTLDLEAGEWSIVPITGRVKPARFGHSITHHGSELYLFGGTDALGAAMPAMLKLRQVAPSRHEWAETMFSLPPNKHRAVLFLGSGLTAVQVGHSALKGMQIAAADLAGGRAVWDVVQCASLDDMEDKAVQPEDLIPRNAKLERVAHCVRQAVEPGRLPHGFISTSSRETAVLQRAAQFTEAWLQAQTQRAQRGPPVPELPLVLKNECGVDKVVCTMLRPTCLPHVELHDLPGIVQFVSEYFTYELLEHSAEPPAHLVSPHTLLDWQAGDSFDLATIECSLLLGAGYNAYVAVGFVPQHIALCDQSQLDCPHLAGLGIEQPPRAEPPPPPAEEEAAAASAGGPSSGAEKAVRFGQMGCISQEAAEGAGEGPVEEGSSGGGGGSTSGCQTAADGEAGPAAAASPAAEPAGGEGAGEAPAEEQLAASSAAGAAATDSTAPADAASADIPAPAATGAEASEGSGSRSDEADKGLPAAVSLSPEGSSDTAGAGPSAGSQEGEGAAEPAAEDAPAPPPAPPRYIHAFVLVKPGSREVSHPLFIDPPSGTCYAPGELLCEGISFVWNTNNAWANLQQHSGSGGEQALAAPGATDWSFAHPSCWEPLLSPSTADAPSSHLLPGSESSLGASFLRGTHSNASVLEPSARLTPRGSTSTASTAGSPVLRGPPGGSGPKLLSLGAKAAHGSLASHHSAREFDAGGSLSYLALSSSCAPEEPHARATPRGLAAKARLVSCPAQGPEMPASWVPALSISRERLDVRCPKGHKSVLYRQCRRDVFARFGECSRWDGLVERVTLYEDAECTQPELVVELFERRKDRVVRRETRPAQRLVRDSFGPGATAALRESMVVKGERRELSFYHEARADGLIRRVEVTGSLLEDFYVGRPDRLTRRKICYELPDLALLGLTGGVLRRGSLLPTRQSLAAGSRQSLAAGAGGVGEGGRKGSVAAGVVASYKISEIKEYYSRDPGTPCDEDVAKRVFELDGDKTTRVACHYGEDEAGMGRLARAVRVYGEDGQVLQNTGAAVPPSAAWCKLEWLRLSAAKRAAEAAARAEEEEMQEIAMARLRQEQSVQLVTGHWDIHRTQVQDSDDEPEGPEEDPTDYLAPFLPSIAGTRDMTAEEAAAVFRKCMQGLRDRTAERSMVLEARRSAETGELRWLEVRAAAELQALSAGEAAQLQEQFADTRFRLGVLEKRIAEHNSITADKLAALEARLHADVRLAEAVRAGLV